MVRYWPIRCSVALSLSLLLHRVTPLELQPIPPATRLGSDLSQKRALSSALELQNFETFLWGLGTGPAQPVLANFTVYTPGNSENIISMEKFSGVLKSVACTNTSMTLVFNNKQGLQYAQSSWDWVNRATSHAFIMVAGANDCHWNTYRQPFNVTDVAYNNATDTASLTAMALDWKTIAHSYDLFVSNAPVSDSQIQARHEYDHDGSLDVTHSFPFSKKITASGLTTTLACTDCTSKGKINWDLHVSTDVFIPKHASMKLTPSGLGATATLKLTESGNLTGAFSTSVPIVSIPLEGIKFSEIVDIGPSLDFSVGVDIPAVTGEASVTGGASLTIPDSSIAQFDILDSSQNKFNGWVPSVKPIPISLDAKIEAKLGVYAQSALNIDLKVLDFGYGAGLDLKMPNFEATLTADASTTGACGTTKAFGVQVGATIGADLSVAVTEGKKDLYDLVLASHQFPLAQTCFPFGPSVGASSTSTVTSSTKTSGAAMSTTIQTTNGTGVSTQSPTLSPSSALSGSTTLVTTAYQTSAPSIAVSATGVFPAPSSTPTAQGSPATNSTMQYTPRAVRREEINDGKLMTRLSRHLRSHQLKRL